MDFPDSSPDPTKAPAILLRLGAVDQRDPSLLVLWLRLDTDRRVPHELSLQHETFFSAGLRWQSVHGEGGLCRGLFHLQVT